MPERIYEVWDDPAHNAITVSTPENIERLRADGILGDATLLRTISARTWEEAMRIHHEAMGWAPYRPVGEPQPCPGACGALYYPEGSGECPECGPVPTRPG